MGVIKFVPSDEVPKPSSGRKAHFNKLYTTNWRVMTASKKKDTVAVVIHNFKMFEIHGVTIEEFLANNFTKGTIEKPFTYQINLLSCITCHGEGRVDWIQKAVNRDNLKGSQKVCMYYRRNSHHISRFEPLDIHKDTIDVMYGSIPALFDGYELCSNCKGTGVNSMRLLTYLEG